VVRVPVVAEGALTADLVAALAPVTDFFAIGDEIWRDEDALAALRRLTAPMRG
jgi:thiamine-phosphate pyrophosphorylase